MSIDVHTVSQMGTSQFNRQDRVIMGMQDNVATPPSSTSVTVLGAITPGTGFTSIGTVSIAPTGGTGSGLTAIPTSIKAVSATAATSGTGYAPNDTITQAGGTLQPGGPGASTVLTVATTKVVSATVAAGGSGGTNGTQTVTGTTGTGTKFQASVTVAGGAITAVLSISVAGSYTANPTTLTAEPVTGASLTGAQLSVVMGAATFTVSTAGAYTVAPANPSAQASTSGTGTGATFTTVYGLGSAQITNSGNYTVVPTGMTVTDTASGTGASLAAPTLGGNGNPVYMAITGFEMPATYAVFVEPSMNCQTYVPYASKATNGFTVVLVPPTTGSTLAAGTIDFQILA